MDLVKTEMLKMSIVAATAEWLFEFEY